MKNIILSLATITLIGAILYVEEPPMSQSTEAWADQFNRKFLESEMEHPDLIQEYPRITTADLEELRQNQGTVLDQGQFSEQIPTEETPEEGEVLPESSWIEEPEEYMEPEEPTAEERRAEAIQNEQGMVYMGTYQITAYEWTGNPCANGNYPEEGYTAACNSLPFGTVVYIDGIGYRTIEDRGADWHSDQWIDVYMGDEWTCNQFGVQYLDVWVVE